MTGSELRARRQAAGISIRQLAKLLSRPGRTVTHSRVSDLELGKIGISAAMLERLDAALSDLSPTSAR
jgi:transcriptional regulator with XRE-family HTH domain